jgi:hypothetical protein
MKAKNVMARRSFHSKISRSQLITPGSKAADAPSDERNQPQHGAPLSNAMQLQRTVGNRAAHTILRSSNSPMQISRMPSNKIQRAIMSFAEFQQHTGQAEKNYAANFFEGRGGLTWLDQERKRMNPNAEASTGLTANEVNVNEAFRSVAKEENLDTVSNLYDRILLWMTLYGNHPATARYRDIIEIVLVQIKKRVPELVAAQNAQDNKAQAKAAKSGFLKSGMKALSGATKSAKDSSVSGRDQKLDSSGLLGLDDIMPDMPGSLVAVGMPNDYFLANFLDATGNMDKNRVQILEDVISNLKPGQAATLAQQSAALKGLSQLEDLGVTNLYLLKAVLYAHFKVVLGDAVGTDRDASIGQQLTRQEIDAIVTYSKGEYTVINAEARSATLRPAAAAPALPGNRPAPAVDDDAPKKKYFKDTTTLAVSGLNKLPKHQGTVFRGISKPPAGFDQYVKPGAIIADLGFSSASPSYAAVKTFFNTQQGSKNIVYIIESKTASPIANISKTPHEGEVLFRPGTLFNVTQMWTHDPNGNIPENAPPEVQMILNERSTMTDKDGRTPKEFKAVNSRQPDLQFQGVNKTVVVMAREV